MRIGLWLVGGVAILWFFTFCAWGLLVGKDATWWGSLGQWVGGVGSIVAAVAAVWIAREGWRQSDLEIGRAEKRAREDAIRTEAAKFAMWIELDEELDRFVVKYNNSGSVPVYMCSIESDGPPGFCRRFIGLIPPTEGPRIDWYTTRLLEDHYRDFGRSLAEQTGRLKDVPVDEHNAIFARAAMQLLRVETEFHQGDRMWRLPYSGVLQEHRY